MNRLIPVFQATVRSWPGLLRGRALIGALWLVVGTGALPPLAAAQEGVLGTLLYTPAQRLAMVQARQGPRGTAQSPGTQSRPSSTQLNGVVARARGRGTAWVNGEAVAQGASATTVLRGTEAVVEGHRLRVGESFDNGTGAKTDVVAPGAVRRRVSP